MAVAWFIYYTWRCLLFDICPIRWIIIPPVGTFLMSSFYYLTCYHSVYHSWPRVSFIWCGWCGPHSKKGPTDDTKWPTHTQLCRVWLDFYSSWSDQRFSLASKKKKIFSMSCQERFERPRTLYPSWQAIIYNSWVAFAKRYNNILYRSVECYWFDNTQIIQQKLTIVIVHF